MIEANSGREKNCSIQVQASERQSERTSERVSAARTAAAIDM